MHQRHIVLTSNLLKRTRGSLHRGAVLPNMGRLGCVGDSTKAATCKRQTLLPLNDTGWVRRSREEGGGRGTCAAVPKQAPAAPTRVCSLYACRGPPAAQTEHASTNIRHATHLPGAEMTRLDFGGAGGPEHRAAGLLPGVVHWAAAQQAPGAAAASPAANSRALLQSTTEVGTGNPDQTIPSTAAVVAGERGTEACSLSAAGHALHAQRPELLVAARPPASPASPPLQAWWAG